MDLNSSGDEDESLSMSNVPPVTLPPASAAGSSAALAAAATAVLVARDYARHDRIEIIVRGKGQPARVVGHREVMETRRAVDELEVHLDGASSSIFLSPKEVAEKVRPLAAECDDADVILVQGAWRPLSLSCVFSLQPLVDPARGESCRHVAVCNFEHLLHEASTTRKCPAVGCTHSLSARKLVREDKLRASLRVFRASLPLCAPEPDQVWVSDGGELRRAGPDGEGATAVTADVESPTADVQQSSAPAASAAGAAEVKVEPMQVDSAADAAAAAPAPALARSTGRRRGPQAPRTGDYYQINKAEQGVDGVFVVTGATNEQGELVTLLLLDGNETPQVRRAARSQPRQSIYPPTPSAATRHRHRHRPPTLMPPSCHGLTRHRPTARASLAAVSSTPSPPLTRPRYCGARGATCSSSRRTPEDCCSCHRLRRRPHGRYRGVSALHCRLARHSWAPWSGQRRPGCRQGRRGGQQSSQLCVGRRLRCASVGRQTLVS